MKTNQISYYSSTDKVTRLLGGLWKNLSKRRKQQFAIVLLIMAISSVAEMISLAAILPFLAVLANPLALWNHPTVKILAPVFGINGPQELLLPITISFATAVISAAGIRLLNIWLSGELAAATGSDISSESYRRSMYQPYSIHVASNSSTLISTITADVSRVIGSVLVPFLTLLSSFLIVISIVLTLLVISWRIAIGIGSLIIFVYIIAIQVGKKPIYRLGKKQIDLNQKLIKSLQEGQGAIRDVILDSSQEFYVSIFRQSDRPLRNAAAKIIFLNSYPRLAMEPIGMVMIAITGYILVTQGGVSKALPLLGSLALGAQRLLPTAQKVYEGWAQIRANKGALANILCLLSQPLPQDLSSPINKTGLKNKIEFKDVCFSYGKTLKPVLEGFNITINKGERVGLIGVTGSGKSTAVDLLMGLLSPSKGQIFIDGKDLHDRNHPKRLRAWRSSLAHVPQNIYLADSSIEENIAFGIETDEIDLVKVKKVAKMAMISNFIEDLPNGYHTFVGERGICLSGGQRQRLGIARALYKNADVIIFDEATSALDNSTEIQVMKSIDNLSSDLTIIMIAHRESTLAGCDQIIKIENGAGKNV